MFKNTEIKLHEIAIMPIFCVGVKLGLSY